MKRLEIAILALSVPQSGQDGPRVPAEAAAPSSGQQRARLLKLFQQPRIAQQGSRPHMSPEQTQSRTSKATSLFLSEPVLYILI